MIDYCGIKFKNPMVIASSPLTSKIEWLRAAHRAGAAAVSTKLAFIRQPFYGKLRMHTWLDNGSIICYDRRLDMDESLRLTEQARKETDLILFSNITHDAEDIDGWVLLAKKHEEAGAHLIEANMICPNVGLSTQSILGREGIDPHEHGGAVTGQNPAKIAAIVRALKAEIGIPLVVKLTPNVTDIGVTARAAQDAGADGICVAGGQSSLPLVDIYDGGRPQFPLLRGVSHGSLGGPSTKLLGFSMIANIAKKTHIPIVGGGGLETGEDCIMAMMWGATLTTLCTSVMWYGWEIVDKCVRFMYDYIEKTGQDWKDVIGRSLPNLRSSKDLDALTGWARVDPEKCIGCGRCTKPGHCNAIHMENRKAIVTPEKCLGCGICAGVCPVNAIDFEVVGE